MTRIILAVVVTMALSVPEAHAGFLEQPLPGGFLTARPAAVTETQPDVDADRIRRLTRQRRGQMNVHQALSIALIPILGATAVMGTANRVRIDQGAPLTATDFAVHRGLAIGAASLYITTALLAITAPNPMRDLLGDSRVAGKRDSSKIHRTLAVLHAFVFAALAVTGILDANAPMSADAYAVVNKLHLVEGWAMFGLVTASGIVIATF